MPISITKPTVGGSSGQWGSMLNTALDTVVAQINTNLTDITGLKTRMDTAEADVEELQTAGGSGDVTLTIGTVTKGATPAASITGTAPDFVLNLTLPGIKTGTAGVTFDSNGLGTLTHNYGSGLSFVMAAAALSSGSIVVNYVTGTSTTTTVQLKATNALSDAPFVGSCTIHYLVA